MKKVKLDNGTVITDQVEIFSKIQQYCSHLFENKDDGLKNVTFNELGIKKPTKIKQEIGYFVTIAKLELVLKKMKPNKAPGLDRLTAEFLKLLWHQLKYHIKMQ